MNGSIIRRALVAVVSCLCATPASLAAVGHTGGVADVGPAGNANYSIPLWAPPGVGGMTPALALVYDHRAGNGQLGVGWRLSGPRAITRCVRTIAQDGAAAEITLGGADRFCLDGQRLRQTSGTPLTYGVAGTTYQTEIESHTRVTALGSADGGPAGFRVEYRDGMRATFGMTSDAMQDAINLTAVRSWALSRLEDRNGNAITFHYAEENGSQRLVEVRYTDNLRNPGGRYRVVLQYAPRSDATIGYVAGTETLEGRLLSSVYAQHDGATIRQYHLGYDAGAGGRSRLINVTECAVTLADCLPPTRFTYTAGQPGWGGEQLSYTPVGTSRVLLDVDGDGRDDLAWVDAGQWWYALSNASGMPGSPVAVGATAYSPDRAITLDWDGDGRSDLLVPAASGRWSLLLSRGSGFAPAVDAGLTLNSSAPGVWVHPADIDGDGRDEIVGVTSSESPTVIATLLLFARSATAYSQPQLIWSTPGFSVGARPFAPTGNGITYRRTRVDLNGDGREDVGLKVCGGSSQGGCERLELRVYYGAGTQLGDGFSIAGLHATAPVWTADVNADRLTDLLAVDTRGDLRAYHSRSRGFSFSAAVPVGSYALTNAVVADWDADRLDDLLIPVGGTQWHLIRATGRQFAAPVALSTSLPAAPTTAGDVDGDGLHDLAYAVAGNLWAVRRHAGTVPDLLERIVDGAGNAATFTYGSTSAPAVHGRGGEGPGYPLRALREPLRVVTRLAEAPAGGTTFWHDYSYAGGRVDLQGRGFVGFETRTIVDSRNLYALTEKRELRFPYLGMLREATVRQPSQLPVEVTTHSLDAIVLDDTLASYRVLPYSPGSTTQRHEAGGPRNGALLTESVIARQVDRYGNDLLVTSTVIDRDSSSPFVGERHVLQMSRSPLIDTVNWCLHLDNETRLTGTGPDGTTESRSMVYQIDRAACRVTHVTGPMEAGAVALAESMLHDSCGNVSSVVSRSAGGADERRIGYTYDSRCQFITRIDWPLGRSVAMTWRPDFGVLSEVTDATSRRTRASYDTFGRRLSTTSATGAVTSTELTSCGADGQACGLAAARYRLRHRLVDGAGLLVSEHTSIRDGSGRSLLESSPDAAGQPVDQRTVYDAYGRVAQDWLPRRAGEQGHAVTLTYDALGRLLRRESPTSAADATPSVVSRSFEGHAIRTVDAAGRPTLQWFDALGRLRRSTPPSPAIGSEYRYRPLGALASRTGAAGDVASYEHDARGLVARFTHPDRGTWRFEHNAHGELTREWDPRGVLRMFSYDALGRPLTRFEPSGTLTWSWANSGFLRLQSITGPGYSEAFTYEREGTLDTERVSRQQLTTDGVTLAKGYGWDSVGRLTSLTLESVGGTAYPSQRVGYEYTGRWPSRTTINGTAAYTVQARNADGQVTEALLGNGVRVSTAIDPVNGWLQRERVIAANGATLRDDQYLWDATGRLRELKDVVRNVTRSALYDGGGRLVVVRRNGVSEYEHRIDGAGRSIWRSDVGLFTYPADGRTGATAVGARQFTYNTLGQIATRDGGSLGFNFAGLAASVSTASGARTDLTYRAGGELLRRVSSGPSGTETTHYFDSMVERVTAGGRTWLRHHVPLGNGALAVINQDPAVYSKSLLGGTTMSPPAAPSFVLTDHLGSPNLLLAGNGAVVARAAFGVAGQRRHPDTGAPLTSQELAALRAITPRGFTGHEQLDDVGLVFMQARLYDPGLGQFVSPDPLLDDFGGARSGSAYGYVEHDPLSRIDPTGMFEQFSNSPCQSTSDGYLSDIATCIDYGFGNSSWLINGWLQQMRNRMQSLPAVLRNTASGIRGAATAAGQVVDDALGYSDGVMRLSQQADKVVEAVIQLDQLGIQLPLQTTAAVTASALAPERIDQTLTVAALTPIGGAPLVGRSAAGMATSTSTLVMEGRGFLAAERIPDPIIIGEGMKRVGTAATFVPNAIILDDMPNYRRVGRNPDEVSSLIMQHNRRWLLQNLQQGRAVIDIGWDARRRDHSIFYAMELRMIENYRKMHPKR